MRRRITSVPQEIDCKVQGACAGMAISPLIGSATTESAASENGIRCHVLSLITQKLHRPNATTVSIYCQTQFSIPRHNAPEETVRKGLQYPHKQRGNTTFRNIGRLANAGHEICFASGESLCEARVELQTKQTVLFFSPPHEPTNFAIH